MTTDIDSKALNAIAAATLARYCPHVPYPKQQSFLELRCREAFFGGAAGGGKSDALLMAALQYVHVPGYAALIVRRDTQRLALAGGLIPRSQAWLAGKGATWNGQRRQWLFTTGGPPATLSFGYLSNPNDKYRYASSEFQYVGFDELTELLEADYLFLFSRLRRLRDMTVPLRVRSASNPGNIGHLWVKTRFIASAAKEVQGSEFTVQSWHAKPTLNLEPGTVNPLVTYHGDRAFVPARIADNPALDEAEYRATLAYLPPLDRERLMNGDWSVSEEGLVRAAWLRYYAEVTTAGQTQLELLDPAGRLLTIAYPARCRRFVTVDPAGTSADKAREARGRTPSHTVAQVWEQPRRELAHFLLLRHQARVLVNFPELCRTLRELHAQWQPERIWIENERLGQAVVDQLGRELPLACIRTQGKDKVARAANLFLKLERGEIFLPRHENAWRPMFEAELLAWTGRDDQPTDQIDAAAYAAIIATQQAPGPMTIQRVT